ncbi:bactofilin family protein [Rhodohalobacter mucosus]|uniref:Polymer-forming cytoskeletal protein n=1 Tax=Rhodohalobacter mucosus TaxID=2079485 RepID=A0A316U0L2_9BACT|nr:polymer-forming cytoskeletal protein [Rhodohalobacter mucosus]PWN06246.1 polymer-forming cytoskeletal protein [Rhodohalobacter mucosus]
MFNNKNDNKVNGTQSSQSPALNMVSEGTTFKGTIDSSNDIRIAGVVEGEAITKGKLIITSSGVVNGDSRVGDADVAGKVEGTLHVGGKLNLRQSAVVNGDVYTKTLIVEEGAQINGACRMGTEGKTSSSAGSTVSKLGADSKERTESK